MLLNLVFMEHNRYILVNNKQQHNWYIKSTNNVGTNEDSIVKSITIHQLAKLSSSFYMHINQILIARQQQASSLIMIYIEYVIIASRQI